MEALTQHVEVKSNRETRTSHWYVISDAISDR